MATNEETNAAGTDTRPPMLVEDDYDSWKIRIQRYIRGKPNGKLIWKSIQNGPTPHPMVTDPPPTGSTIVPGPRKKLDSEFNDEENKLEMADTQAEIILSQGLPRHIFNILQIRKHCSGDVGTRSILISMPMSLMPKKTLKKTGAVSSIVDLLAMLAHTTSAPIANLLSWFPKAVSIPQQPAPDFPPKTLDLLRCLMVTLLLKTSSEDRRRPWMKAPLLLSLLVESGDAPEEHLDSDVRLD
ncbi:hypothetical protein Tco_0730881 [Tanacetum coccineum]